MTNEKNEKIVQAKAPEMTKSAKIWEEIKGKTIDIFAIPQKVEDVCAYVEIDTEKCFLTMRASSVLPILEEAIKDKYECELVHKYVVIQPKKREY